MNKKKQVISITKLPIYYKLPVCFLVILISLTVFQSTLFAQGEELPNKTAKEPSPELKRPTEWGEPTEVEILTYLIDVDEVDSALQSFAASIYYEARWKSSYLKHKGPSPMHRRVTEVWTPRLTILSQQMAWKAFPEYVQIEPDGTAVYRQKIWGRFSQPLELKEFPFDKQTLSIHLLTVGLLEDQVKIVPLIKDDDKRSAIAEKFSLPDFDIVSWDSKPRPYHAFKGSSGTAGYEVEIVISRRSGYYLLKMILPLCLIVIMSWLPRWIDPSQIGVNIGISTTSFLTLVAYLFAITVLLPKVSYVTRMDRFILLSTLLVFTGLIQTAFDTYLVNNKKEKLAKNIGRVSRYIYPTFLIGILYISFRL